ncbi:hypothetical protein NNC19_12745 [Clostridium sp. SHJSY1]|uniref:hypothetical protein n=1 Tax=Clostridium sp. SHJSY1 TaxID=2942483 RepID=UPI002874F646|nr:hypothetical protein [Clostridium sp. SHJSY1]MDS0526552.1 hypothetical protein [Clostridium sp. SHJSY1]
MSISASIDVKLARNNNEKISAKKLISILISDKWRLQDNGKISYLPLGDDDDFDWQYDEISINELMDIVDKKEERREVIGLIMLWDTTEIGVNLLIHSELELSFSCSINRKKLNNLDNRSITDVNWYVEKIIPLLQKNNYIVESFSFEEYC